MALAITAVGLRSVGFGATHFSLDKIRMGGGTFQPKNSTFLKPTVIGGFFICSLSEMSLRLYFVYLFINTNINGT